MANKKKENESVPSTPLSRLDVYKELQAIKDRVSNVTIDNIDSDNIYMI